MKKTVATVCCLAAVVAAGGGVSGGSAPLQINVTIDTTDRVFYQRADTVSFPAVMRGGEPAEYRNASYQEFATWQVSDVGVERVRSMLAQRFGGSLDGVTSGSTPDAIEFTYVVNGSLDRGFSYQDLVDATPSRVEGTVQFPDETVQVSVPVTVKKATVSQRALGDAVRKGGAEEGFGSSGGPQYNASFTVTGTTTGNHTGDRLEQVVTRQRHVSFTGHIEVADPCVSLHHTYEETGDTLVLNVSTRSGSGFCTQVVAMKTYRFDLNASAPVTLQVVHDGTTVRTISTAVSHPDDEPFYSFIFDIISLVAGLLP